MARVAPGQFQSSADGQRVFFIDSHSEGQERGRNVFMVLGDAQSVQGFAALGLQVCPAENAEQARPILHRLAKEGVERVDVICPGFTSDCLETLEEIAMEGKADFLAAGGKTYGYIPCLNERPDWIEALADIVTTHLSGWPTREAPDQAALEQSALRAQARGASR